MSLLQKVTDAISEHIDEWCLRRLEEKPGEFDTLEQILNLALDTDTQVSKYPVGDIAYKGIMVRDMTVVQMVELISEMDDVCGEQSKKIQEQREDLRRFQHAADGPAPETHPLLQNDAEDYLKWLLHQHRNGALGDAVFAYRRAGNTDYEDWQLAVINGMGHEYIRTENITQAASFVKEAAPLLVTQLKQRGDLEERRPS